MKGPQVAPALGAEKTFFYPSSMSEPCLGSASSKFYGLPVSKKTHTTFYLISNWPLDLVSHCWLLPRRYGNSMVKLSVSYPSAANSLGTIERFAMLNNYILDCILYDDVPAYSINHMVKGKDDIYQQAIHRYRLTASTRCSPPAKHGPNPNYALLVSNLDSEACKASLFALLQPRYSSLKSVKILSDDPASHCAMACFEAEGDQLRAVTELDGIAWRGQHLRVRIWREYSGSEGREETERATCSTDNDLDTDTVLKASPRALDPILTSNVASISARDRSPAQSSSTMVHSPQDLHTEGSLNTSDDHANENHLEIPVSVLGTGGPNWLEISAIIAETAFRIRSSQQYKDGNHRTATLFIYEICFDFGRHLKADPLLLYGHLSNRRYARSPLDIIDTLTKVIATAEIFSDKTPSLYESRELAATSVKELPIRVSEYFRLLNTTTPENLVPLLRNLKRTDAKEYRNMRISFAEEIMSAFHASEDIEIGPSKLRFLDECNQARILFVPSED